MPFRYEDLSDSDKFVYDEIFNWNVYHVDSKDLFNRTVIDIGAHYGMFVDYCVQHGAKEVVAVEANPLNYLKLIKNVSVYPNVKTLNVACDTTTGNLITINNDECKSRVNTGNINVVTVSLQELIDSVRASNLLLKMDIEGAEHNIINNTPVETFSRIDTICIEAHGEDISGPGNTIEKIKTKIISLGYVMSWYGVFYTKNQDNTSSTNENIAVFKFNKI